MKVNPQLPKLDSPAHQALTAALTNAVARDLFIPCAGPWDGDPPWLSDDPDERVWAADLCTGCPAITECREAGELEKFGVWGAVDRTPPPSSSSRRKPNPPAENTHLQEIS